MADVRDEVSTRGGWRRLLRDVGRAFEDLVRTGKPKIVFLASPNADPFPPMIGPRGDAEDFPFVHVEGGIFPQGILFPEGSAPFGHFAVPTHVRDSVWKPAWEEFQNLAIRAWTILPPEMKENLGWGAQEILWMAVVCKTLLDANTGVVFNRGEFAGINTGVGAAQASADAIRLLCQTEGGGESAGSDRGEPAPDADHERDAKQPAQVSDADQSDEAKTEKAAPTPFSGGTLVFFENRVELCGVNICGRRAKSSRKILDALRERRGDRFIAYSGEELAAKTQIKISSLAGVVRDIRERIQERLLAKANFACGESDVLITDDEGYRLTVSINVSVQLDGIREQGHGSLAGEHGDPVNAAIHDPVNVPVRDPVTARDPVKIAEHDPVTDSDNPVGAPLDPVTRSDDTATDFEDPEARKDWIFQQIAAGRELRAPQIAEEIGCSEKTAKRDLDALKDEGKIEFVGAPRNGFYRHKEPPAQTED